MKLYPAYQVPAYQRLCAHFEQHATALMVMATGLGKSVVAAFVGKDWHAHGMRGLVIAHDTNILEQLASTFAEVYGPRVRIGFFNGQRKDFEDVHILCATFQTMTTWKDVFFPSDFDYVIVDESHHSQALTFKPVIRYFTPRYLLGMTATPERQDMKDIRELFGDEVVDISLEEAIAKGWLTPVEYHVRSHNINRKKLQELAHRAAHGRRVSLKQLNETIFLKPLNEEIARHIEEIGLKTIIFCERIEHAEEFSRYLPGSFVVHSRLSHKENRAALDAFKRGLIEYICVVDKLNEGIDIPDAEHIVFLRCTDSPRIFLQQLGRGLRKTPDKDKVIVSDYVANCNRVSMLKDMVDRIRSHMPPDLCPDVLHLRAPNLELEFDDTIVDILSILARMKRDFYSTWQEAAHSTRALKIETMTEYKKRYREDPRLPSNPHKFYPDFPGWRVFLGKK